MLPVSYSESRRRLGRLSVERSLFKYIIRFSRRDQILLTLMAAASFPFLYLSYDVPKTIVNQAIAPKRPFTAKDIGFDIVLDQLPYLFLLCGAFVALVLINQGFKYAINVYKGRTAERMLRRIRFELYGRVLRFPLPTFRRMSQGEIIPMVVGEVEPLGGFVGESFSLPAFQGGTLLTILGFLMWQDWRMALAAVMLYPFQFWLIPKIQRRIRLLSKERTRRVRRLSDRISETVSGVQEIHAHDTSRYFLTGFASQLGDMFELRFRIYNLKFLVKLLNNFIQQLGPFFFYSIGGYLVINGELEMGTLVAAIAAHKDLAAPWKELLAYYEMQQDAAVKYELIVSQFDPPGLREPESQLAEPAEQPRLTGELQAATLVLKDDHDHPVLDGVSFRLPLDKHVALVGPAGGGREELTLLLARLLDPDRGQIAAGGLDFAKLPEAVTGRRIAYVGQNPYIFAGSIADNLYFGLMHRPVAERQYQGQAASERHRYVREAQRSGNIDYDLKAPWIDHLSAGADDRAELQVQALRVLDLVGMGEDVYQMGLRGTIDPGQRADLADAMLRARLHLRERLADPAVATLVEGFDRDRYNDNASVAENLLFGSLVGDALNLDRLAEHPYVLQVLEKVELVEPFLQAGFQVASTMVELFSGLPPDHALFEQFSFIAADDLPEAQAMLQRADRNALSQLALEDRKRLMSLPFKLIHARHRLGVIDDALKAKILTARRAFAEGLPPQLKGAIEFFDAGRYNAAANLQDNILFGKVAYGQAEAQEQVGRLLRQVVDELGLRRQVAEVGLNFQVGIAGARLGSQQRIKLALARAVMKRPDLLILSETTAALDLTSQQHVLDGLLAEFAGRGVIWSAHRTDMANRFDQVLVLQKGRVVEQGSFAELNKENTRLHALLNAA